MYGCLSKELVRCAERERGKKRGGGGGGGGGGGDRDRDRQRHTERQRQRDKGGGGGESEVTACTIRRSSITEKGRPVLAVREGSDLPQTRGYF